MRHHTNPPKTLQTYCCIDVEEKTWSALCKYFEEKQRKVFAHNFKITNRIFVFSHLLLPNCFLPYLDQKTTNKHHASLLTPFQLPAAFYRSEKTAENQLLSVKWMCNHRSFPWRLLPTLLGFSFTATMKPMGGRRGGDHNGQVCGVRALSHKQEKWLWHCRLFKSPHWAS